MDDENLTFKVITIGDCGVGKTSIKIDMLMIILKMSIYIHLVHLIHFVLVFLLKKSY